MRILDDFRQDGAKSHNKFLPRVREIFPGKLNRRISDINWTPRSSDLSHKDFFYGTI